MRNALRPISRQLKKSGKVLLPTFDSSVTPGTILRVRKWNDITIIGSLARDPGISAAELEPPPPGDCFIPDVDRRNTLTLKGALELIQPNVKVKGEMNRVKEVRMEFVGLKVFRLDLMFLEELVERDPKIWNRMVGERLRSKRHFVAYEVIRGRLSMHFLGSGDAGIDVESAIPAKNIKALGGGAKYSWTNGAVLETTKDVVIAVDLLRYDFKKGVFREERSPFI